MSQVDNTPTIVLDHERFYLNDVDCILYAYGDRTEILLGLPSELQLPVDQGLSAAFEKAHRIAEACGYTAYVDEAGQLHCFVHGDQFILVWNHGPKRHLLSHVFSVSRNTVAYPRCAAPELWARLERQPSPEAN